MPNYKKQASVAGRSSQQESALASILEDCSLLNNADDATSSSECIKNSISSSPSPLLLKAAVHQEELASETNATLLLLQLPVELQVNWLTYLRAYDLSAVHQTCRYYRNPVLVHAIVVHCAERVYPRSLTAGFQDEPVLYNSPAVAAAAKSKKGAAVAAAESETPAYYYTLEHLRNMELLVVARVLSQPEPSTGYVVSKSWCKAALKWLELQSEQRLEKQKQLQQQQQQQKKGHGKGHAANSVSKKKQRLRQRRLSDACPPWPDANGDLLCEHMQLKTCSNSKTARARRKLLDKQAWKTLRKLFPDSTPLTELECVQCVAEAESGKRTAAFRKEVEKQVRQAPLADPLVRRFYTRTKGVPEAALLLHSTSTGAAVTAGEERCLNDEINTKDWEDQKLPCTLESLSTYGCPLQPGTYYILPRAWCYGWRRYLKTGEGGMEAPAAVTAAAAATNSSSGHGSPSSSKHASTAATPTSWYPPPDATSLLCHAHRLLLPPPHLEEYLYGEREQLLSYSNNNNTSSEELRPEPVAAAAAAPAAPTGAMDPASLQALLAAGLSPAEVRRQLVAMRQVEQQRPPPPPPAANNISNPQADKERLDRENHVTVEIVTAAEYAALERVWPQHAAAAAIWSVSLQVDGNGKCAFGLPVCRACDATGLQYSQRRHHPSQMEVHRRRRWGPARPAAPGLEY